MTQTLSLTHKLSILLASLAVLFGFSLTAYAYDDLEIKIEVKEVNTKVEVKYQEDDEDVESKYRYSTTSVASVYELLAHDLDITVAEVKDAVTKVSGDDENDDDEEDDNDDEEEDDNRGHGNNEDKCDLDNPGHSQEKRCDVDEEKETRHTDMEKFKDFGKTTDRTELQKQLQELLLILIQLLQQSKIVNG